MMNPEAPRTSGPGDELLRTPSGGDTTEPPVPLVLAAGNQPIPGYVLERTARPRGLRRGLEGDRTGRRPRRHQVHPPRRGDRRRRGAIARPDEEHPPSPSDGHLGDLAIRGRPDDRDGAGRPHADGLPGRGAGAGPGRHPDRTPARIHAGDRQGDRLPELAPDRPSRHQAQEPAAAERRRQGRGLRPGQGPRAARWPPTAAR